MGRSLYSVVKAPHVLRYRSNPRRQQTIQFFGLVFVLEAFVTLPNSNVSTNAAGTALTLTGFLKSVLKDGNNITANENWKDADGLERWCRDQGLLIEINDADYAEPKLTVVS